METRKKQYRREYYVDGTAARQLAVLPNPQWQEEQVQKPQKVRKPAATPRLSHGIDFFSMALFLTAMAISLYLCYDYLQVQGNIVQLKRDITGLENAYDTLASQNTALEESLNRPLDWEKVYLTAVGELGMVYPNKNEVISYKPEEEGYVIQYKDIPE